MAQQILPHSQSGRPDLLRRSRLRTRVRDAPGHLSREWRIPRQRPGHGVKAADHGGRGGYLHPGARRVPGARTRGAARDGGRLERLAGQPLAGQPQQLARALARVDLCRHRRPGSDRSRDRALGRASVHGADPDQGRAASVVGRPQVRPDLGRSHQARHHGELSPIPQPLRRAADAAGWIPQLQPRFHGDLLAAGRKPGDEPDLRRRLRPVPDTADRICRARLHLDPATDVADGRDLRGAQVVDGHQAQAVGVRQGPHQVHHPAAGLPGGQDRVDPRVGVDGVRQDPAVLL